MTCLSGSELQLWRRGNWLASGIRLLPWTGCRLEGGLLWTELQASYLHPEEPVQLRCCSGWSRSGSSTASGRCPCSICGPLPLAGFGAGSQSSGGSPVRRPSCWWMWRSPASRQQPHQRWADLGTGSAVWLGLGAPLARQLRLGCGLQPRGLGCGRAQCSSAWTASRRCRAVV